MTRKYPRYSASQLEEIAESFARWLKATVPGDINIERIAAEKLQFDVFPSPGLKKATGVYAYVNTKQSHIFVDQYTYDHYEETFNFTLAEEIAHVILHKDVLPHTTSIEEHIDRWRSIPVADYHMMDRNAKYLAAAMLMPRALFTKRFRELWKTHEVLSETDLVCLYAVQRQLRIEFRVGERALSYRCNALRLTNRANEPVDI